MKRAYLLLLLSSVLLSCTRKQAPLTPAQVQHYIDSTAAARIAGEQTEAAIQLEHRLRIEAKPKADSIVEALTAPKAVRDSLARSRDTTSRRRASSGPLPFPQPQQQ